MSDRPDRPLVIASNRGPISFSRASDGSLESRRGGGGLVSSLAPVVTQAGAIWLASAMGDADREAAARGVVDAQGFRLRMVNIPATTYRMFYDVAFNQGIWFMHHHLWDLSRRPRFDRHFRAAWSAYRDVNEVFASEIAAVAPEGADVLVQDHHLALVGATLASRRPDLRTVNFCHTPFATPDMFRVLPTDIGAEFLSGLAGFRACGFHTQRWADAFGACCDEVLRSRPHTFVGPPAPDLTGLREVVNSAECARELRQLGDQVGDTHLIVRVDRIELSKNLLRGFHAYAAVLEDHPEVRGKVSFAAMVYPSREGLADYRAYRQEIENLVDQVNGRYGTDTWTPILYDPSDNFPRSVAALRRYDTLLVNPIRDGLNLVAMEGPLVNEQDGTVILSREAGAHDHIGGHTTVINPFDVDETAARLFESLRVPRDLRAARAAKLRAAIRRRSPRDWVADQRQAAEAPVSRAV